MDADKENKLEEINQFISYSISEGVIDRDTADELFYYAKHYVENIMS